MELKDKIASIYSSVIAQRQAKSLEELRRKNYAVFEQMGFPTKKQEAWKYTSLLSLLKVDYQENAPCGVSLSDTLLNTVIDKNNYRLVFVDGVFSEEFSKTEGMPFRWSTMNKIFQSEENYSLIQPYFSNIAPDNEPLTALNTAVTTYGTFISVPKNTVVETPVEIIYITSEANHSNVFFPRNLVVLESNAQLKIIEQHKSFAKGTTFVNAVTEIYVDENAVLDYYKIENDSVESSLIDNTYTLQKGNSVASVHTFSFGGNIVRNNLNFDQQGQAVESTLKGITVLDGTQHTDHYTLVKHALPHNESHQDYKTILLGNSSCVFNGKIWVDKIAQKTNAYQQNDTILLSDKAVVNTKPQLEIFADDVKCSHGCTVGQLDSDAIFYLQTRGIPKKEAEALLTYAFAHTVLSSVKIDPLKDLIHKLLSERLGVAR